MLRSAEARVRLMRELCGHGLQQALFAWRLADDLAYWPPLTRVAADAGCVLLAYAAFVVLVALAVPPHKLPYVMKAVR